MSLLISLGVTFEIIFVILAAFSEIRRRVSLSTEAYVYSTILVFSIFSLSIHLFFLFGIHKFYFLFDALLLFISTYFVYRNWETLVESYENSKEFCKRNSHHDDAVRGSPVFGKF